MSLLLALAGLAGAQVAPVAPWKLVFADEFEGRKIDRKRWNFDVDCWGGGNQERQCYTASRRNAYVEGGVLHIVARKGQSTGYALPDAQRMRAANPRALATKEYSSARMVTRGRAAWRYGKVEVRAKLPQGQGTWPAIWMLPEKNVYGPWASSGEIDILEAVNLGVPCASCEGGRENTILGTLHFGGVPPANKFKSTEIAYPQVLDGGFHTYGVIWSEGRIDWTVDGRVYATQTAADWFSSATADDDAPFDQPFHLILNLAIGGHLPEGRGVKGVDPTGFPKAMEVDWVRVWQCAADPGTGRACAR
ncbi:glycoside hydrolase family 16 protein [Sphingomonas astaxanthinifaciens]|uniref:Beta-glucanase n=1 Tax=Sphingomonas astaxanthinifaciens DSM 22298 TaxID=1123267 RepID=A0ABQ5Z8R8_9SPHN|nr:glycoside hydrolase family 16 protein [Sphingomonas astaxanthinifaciens]GLR48349.1 beta-glucanase [Sphingomonas astaxanthinifaciens DSM 22298]